MNEIFLDCFLRQITDKVYNPQFRNCDLYMHTNNYANGYRPILSRFFRNDSSCTKRSSSSIETWTEICNTFSDDRRLHRSSCVLEIRGTLPYLGDRRKTKFKKKYRNLRNKSFTIFSLSPGHHTFVCSDYGHVVAPQSRNGYVMPGFI